MPLPENNYFTHISSVRNESWGIDNNGDLWIWSRYQVNWLQKAEDQEDLLEDRDSWGKPVLFKWLKDKNLRVLDVKAGKNFAVALV